MDCSRQNWGTALEHLNRSLRFDTDNLRARNLKVVVLRRLDRRGRSRKTVARNAGARPARLVGAASPGEIPANGHKRSPEAQVRLDIAHDFARAGFYAEAIGLLEN